MKFKAGDKVIQQQNCRGSVKGQKYTLQKVTHDGRVLTTHFKQDSDKGCTCTGKWKLYDPSGEKIIDELNENNLEKMKTYPLKSQSYG